MKNLIAIVWFAFSVLSCNNVQDTSSVASLSYTPSTAVVTPSTSLTATTSSVSLMESKVEAVAIQTADFDFKPKAETGKSWFKSQKPKINSDTDELPDSITFD